MKTGPVRTVLQLLKIRNMNKIQHEICKYLWNRAHDLGLGWTRPEFATGAGLTREATEGQVQPGHKYTPFGEGPVWVRQYGPVQFSKTELVVSNPYSD